MKNENRRLGRCASCRYWKSATDLLAERAGPDASPDQVEEARKTVRQELTQDLLNVEQADYRGWCTAAEQGTSAPGEFMAVNLLTHSAARMITVHDFGCTNHQPRPRRAMSTPTAAHHNSPDLGRCSACRFWSSADNEAHALLSMARYTDPNARPEDAEKEALTRLSPEPLKPETANRRGWCKIASNYADSGAKNLAIDPSTGSVGALITSDDFACIRHVDTSNPLLRTTPGWRWMVDRSRLYNLGPSAPLNELLWSYLDPATLLDPEHPLSPLHAEHPLNIRNPRSLYYNPNPAFAAYLTHPSLVQTVTNPDNFRPEPLTGRPGAPARSPMPFTANPNENREAAVKQLMAQARLAQDFAARTLKMGGGDLEAGPSVSLGKKSDAKKDNDRRKQPKNKKYTRKPAPGGFIDRRKT